MSSRPETVIRLRPQADPEIIRKLFTRVGRVHLPGFFAPDSATRIYKALSEETPWQLSLNSGDRHVDLAQYQIDMLPPERQVLLVEGLNRNARDGFQYIFNNFPIHDLYAAGQHREHFLMRVYECINSREFLEFARAATGLPDIAAADAQATLYRPGHFLTAHDDSIPGKNRLAAYVLNFTPQWRADWGGILQFIDADGHIAEGYTPAFNALNLLRVPQKHSVSYVSPAAAGGRYSITGWLLGS